MPCCYHCDTQLSKKEGLSKFCVQLEDSIAIVESDSPYFCQNCNGFFLTSEKLVDSFMQLQDSLQKKTTITKGVYS